MRQDVVGKVKSNFFNTLKFLYFKILDTRVRTHELLLNASVGRIPLRTIVDSNSIVAITISTGYNDLLEYILPQNINFFKKWIIVTDNTDIATQNLVSQYPEIELISLNFKSFGSVFNKGRGVRKAQLSAYKKFPNSWYLLLDSDIILSDNFSNIVKNLGSIPKESLYGCNVRRDFSKLSELKSESNFIEYIHEGEIHGYFQMYTRKYLYRDSTDASWCDLQFSKKFSTQILLEDFHCNHLGMKGNWQGRKLNNFIFD